MQRSTRQEKMLKRFSTKQIVFLALIGALLFVVDLVLSTGIDAATGIFGSGYLVTSIFFVLIATLGGLIVKKFWTYTIMALIYAALSVPTPVFGPPGVYKIVLGVSIGLIADLVVLCFRYKNTGYYLALTIANVLSLFFGYYALIILGLPGIDQLREYLFLFSVWYALTGVLGAWLALLLYKKKIEKMKVVQQIAS